jgi:uncharacterized protein DUF4253
MTAAPGGSGRLTNGAPANLGLVPATDGAQAVAAEHYAFCHDLADICRSTTTRGLIGAGSWACWWD